MVDMDGGKVPQKDPNNFKDLNECELLPSIQTAYFLLSTMLGC